MKLRVLALFIALLAIPASGMKVIHRGQVTVGGPTQAPAIWSDNTNTRAVWFLEESGGSTRVNAKGTTTMQLTAQTTLPTDGTTGNFMQGTFSNDFDTTNYLKCTDTVGGAGNCGGTSALDFTTSYTIGCWGYADTAGTNRRLMSKTASGAVTTGYYMQRTNSSNRLSCVNTNTQVDAAATTFSVGEWVHAVCTYNGTNVQPYVNGTASGTATAVATPADVTGEFRLGMRSDATTAANAWDGRLDECFVVAGALSAAQVCRIARCGMDGEYCVCDGGTPANYHACNANIDCLQYGTTGTCTGGTCSGRSNGVCVSGSNAGEPCAVAGDCTGGTCTQCTPVACNDSGP